MARFAQLTGIAALGKTLLEMAYYRRLIPSFLLLVMFAVMTGMLLALLLAALFFAAYHLLLRHGLDADMAFAAIAGVIALMMVISGMLTAAYARRLRQSLQPLSPITSGVSDIAGAFMEGLRNPVE